MPQINRIRVNNVKYNFGTQFYDDFLMRFSCKNTIYDLANGGGKSVLMLLLLQTMIPNCTLDEKQPVEKLFRTADGSTTIHSLVEWKLDSCDVKDGFRYMTCGFCARKGRDTSARTEEIKGAQGDAAGAPAAALEEKKGDSASIEYFNYCIFYREFGDNDIKNLPLASGRERITYNGLKSYLRELEKRDLGVQVKIFERKGDYQSFISDYGIYESHWEIIRGINKTEGHVRTYFENSYKTTRKVVEDLLIEEIVEKSYNNRIRGGSGDDGMAKTLLDIKDKLLELARRRENMESYERQIGLLKEFSKKAGDFGEIYARKEAQKTALLTYLSGAKAQAAASKELAAELAAETERLKSALSREERLISMARIAGEKEELRELSELVGSLNERLNALSGEYEECQKSLLLAQTAADYKDYLEHERTLAKLKEYMDNRHKDRSDITGEMKRLAAAKHGYMTEALKECEALAVRLAAEEEAGAGAIGRLKEDSRVQDNERAKAEGILSGLTRRQSAIESELKEKMKGTSLLVSDRAEEEAERLKADLNKTELKRSTLAREREEIKQKQEYCIKETASVEARLPLLSETIKRSEEEFHAVQGRAEELDALGRVYGEKDPQRLLEVVEKLYDDMLRNREELKRKRNRLEALIRTVESGKFGENEGAKELYAYLSSRYEDRVAAGGDYLMEIPEEDREELLSKAPYLPYSIVIRQDYETILADKNIMTFDCEGVVPLLNGAELLQEESGGRFLVCRDLSFIYDDAGKQAGLKGLTEEAQRLDAELLKVSDRGAVVFQDYEKISAFVRSGLPQVKELEERLRGEKKEYASCEEKKRSLYELRENLAAREKELGERYKDTETAYEECRAEWEALLYIAKLNEELNKILSEIGTQKQAAENAAKAKRLSEELLRSKEKNYSELTAKIRQNRERAEQIREQWEKNYRAYYDESENAEGLLEEKEVDARFEGLRQLITQELGDLSDKERLMENCRENMERIERGMQYRGLEFSAAKGLYEEGRLPLLEHDEIMKITARRDALKREMGAAESELSGAGAQMNRMEGSVAHAERSLTERYGEWEPMEIPRPQEFERQHRNESARLRELLTEGSRKEKENSDIVTGYLLMEKDLERIVRSMGIDPDSVAAGRAPEDARLTAGEYEEAGKHFDRILREETRKKEAFLREKDMLVEALTKINALELAQEIKRSVEAPEDQGAAESLIKGLAETVDYIVLERDHIGRGIQDMELIKDNFVNRCVQICSNIRSELERLPKLSRITLDDEVIPVLSLQIPYIKEELYKDRMSVYINETVAAAENFKTSEEKLKYIKGRLTWKRLFSVIVTDMNSIKLNLYKRERIKDQSRYLRYEEAVGSTGQSQGIYIQFLVAVINYIASINARGKEAAVLGKTIFIDNPFGAAKDVYIWEPIFKLLKTNHVQLVVPARGATPAITGRFDVNYVLGQKLSEGRQQTVVVDYRSQVAESELEYERLSFSQESFDFLN